MLLSTLVPLGLVLTVGAVAVSVARARHRKNVGECPGCSPSPPPSLNPHSRLSCPHGRSPQCPVDLVASP